MRHLIDLFARLLISGTDTWAGAAILLDVFVAVLVSTAHLLTKALATVKVRSNSANAVSVGPYLMTDVARSLIYNGSTTGVEDLLSYVLESAVDREASCTDIACGLVLVHMHP